MFKNQEIERVTEYWVNYMEINMISFIFYVHRKNKSNEINHNVTAFKNWENRVCNNHKFIMG